MNRPTLLLALVLTLLLVFYLAMPASAMPEYATLTGEPCASCHVSPAGGGLRNLRGQAWVLQDKPSAVPSTTEALAALGIQLPSDMSIYTVAPATAPAAAPLAVPATRFTPLFSTLCAYEGN